MSMCGFFLCYLFSNLQSSITMKPSQLQLLINISITASENMVMLLLSFINMESLIPDTNIKLSSPVFIFHLVVTRTAILIIVVSVWCLSTTTVRLLCWCLFCKSTIFSHFHFSSQVKLGFEFYIIPVKVTWSCLFLFYLPTSTSAFRQGYKARMLRSLLSRACLLLFDEQLGVLLVLIGLLVICSKV